jgi:hypothetical protein
MVVPHMRSAIYLATFLLALGMLVAPATAQMDNQTENDTMNQSFDLTGECMVTPDQADYMTCRFNQTEEQNDDGGLFGGLN